MALFLSLCICVGKNVRMKNVRMLLEQSSVNGAVFEQNKQVVISRNETITVLTINDSLSLDSLSALYITSNMPLFEFPPDMSLINF